MEFKYKAYTDIKMYDPTDEELGLYFSVDNAGDKNKFVYLKGRVLSREVNKKRIRFTDKAMQMAENNFKPAPFLIEHNHSLEGMIGTVTSLKRDDNGLNYFAIVPNIDANKKYIDLLNNDTAGLIKVSIGGVSRSITCSICNKELYEDSSHYLGQKYGNKVAFGNVNDWRTDEISLTIFPADTKTSANMYEAGFNNLEELRIVGRESGENGNVGKKLINDNDQNMVELNMSDMDENKQNSPDVSSTINEGQIVELVQKAIPDNFVTKDELGEIKQLIQSFVEEKNKEKEIALSIKRKKLSELTGKSEELYVNLSENAIDILIDEINTIKPSVPNELGVVQHTQGGNNFGKRKNVTPEMRKEAIRVILGIAPTSEKVKKVYSVYKRNFGARAIDARISNTLSQLYGDKEEDN